MPSRALEHSLNIPSKKLLLQKCSRLSNAAILVGAWLCVGVASPSFGVQAQIARPPVAASASGAGKVNASSPSKPFWVELTPLQQTALKPLEAQWENLGETQKRRWIALSRNYSRLSAEAQRTLHGRMTEWATLSGRERVQARLNFAEVKQLAPNERKAKWEAYQALSEDDRRKLAEKAPVRPRSAAVPIRPVPAQKLVQVPPPPLKGEHGARIELAPPKIAPEAPTPVSAPGPVTTTPPTAVAPASPAAPMPAPVPAPAIPMVRMTEQPSSAP